jgi:hypothetical protein
MVKKSIRTNFQIKTTALTAAVATRAGWRLVWLDIEGGTPSKYLQSYSQHIKPANILWYVLWCV